MPGRVLQQGAAGGRAHHRIQHHGGLHILQGVGHRSGYVSAPEHTHLYGGHLKVGQYGVQLLPHHILRYGLHARKLRGVLGRHRSHHAERMDSHRPSRPGIPLHPGRPRGIRAPHKQHVHGRCGSRPLFVAYGTRAGRGRPAPQRPFSTKLSGMRRVGRLMPRPDSMSSCCLYFPRANGCAASDTMGRTAALCRDMENRLGASQILQL